MVGSAQYCIFLFPLQDCVQASGFWHRSEWEHFASLELIILICRAAVIEILITIPGIRGSSSSRWLGGVSQFPSYWTDCAPLEWVFGQQWHLCIQLSGICICAWEVHWTFEDKWWTHLIDYYLNYRCIWGEYSGKNVKKQAVIIHSILTLTFNSYHCALKLKSCMLYVTSDWMLRMFWICLKILKLRVWG